MIDSELLNILVAFHQYGTLTRTAEHLHISQPALSASMKKLESALGVSLFTRTKNKLQLTTVGEHAAWLAAWHLSEEEQLIQELREMDRRQKTITLASSEPDILSYYCEIFKRIYPDQYVESEICSEENLLPGLEDSIYDFIFTSSPVSDQRFTCDLVHQVRLLIAVREDHLLSSESSLTFQDIQNELFLYGTNGGFWDEFIRSKFHPDQLIRISTENEYYKLINAFPICTLALQSPIYNSKKLNLYRYIPLDEEESKINFYLCCQKKRSAKAAQFLHYITQQ